MLCFNHEKLSQCSKHKHCDSFSWLKHNITDTTSLNKCILHKKQSGNRTTNTNDKKKRECYKKKLPSGYRSNKTSDPESFHTIETMTDDTKIKDILTPVYDNSIRNLTYPAWK